MKPKIRIQNTNGIPMATKVFDAETGEDLTAKLMIQRITIDIDVATRDITAVLHCADMAIDIVADAEIVTP